jgi:hypothetical protein
MNIVLMLLFQFSITCIKIIKNKFKNYKKNFYQKNI